MAKVKELTFYWICFSFFTEMSLEISFTSGYTVYEVRVNGELSNESET